MEQLWKSLQQKKSRICVVGLGYVGLPLAHAFAGHFAVVGFDVNKTKIAQIKKGVDPTNELPEGGLAEVRIDFTTSPARIGGCSFIVIAVPTPVDNHRKPDLTPMIKAAEIVGKNLKKNSVVVFESTVYPGVTEEICVPILERESGLCYLRDFKVGYSPERINPGDRQHRLETITKVVAGCDRETLDIVAKVYQTIITAGVHRAPTIKVAEAAKVIENTQRDLNIALMNELSIIFHKLGIDTLDVLAAAGTKWNFLKFFPGLVGGHCIGVDPYYLTFKAEEVGYHPQVILAGRRINDDMGKFVAECTVKEMIRVGKTIQNARVLILGVTFKENVADIRNTKIIDIVHELKEYGVKSFLYDPWAHPTEVFEEYGIQMLESLKKSLHVDAVILAVPHRKFRDLTLKELAKLCDRGEKTPILMDLKGFFDGDQARHAGFRYWRL